MLLIILVILLVLGWGGGLALHVGGDFIHILLVVALIFLVVRLVQGRSSTL